MTDKTVEPQKNYYSITPATVRYDKNLTAMAKTLYGEITALCNEKGYCWASNSYFEELYGVSKQTIINWINNLKKGGYINTELEYEPGTKTVKQRKIFICDIQGEFIKDNLTTPSQKDFTTPSQKNLTYNNTNINNTVINIKENIKRKVFDYTENEEFRQAIFDFIDFRKSIKSPMNERAITLLFNQLDKLAKLDETKIEILNQSILNGWKSVYEIKEDKNNANSNIRVNKRSEDDNRWNGTVL